MQSKQTGFTLIELVIVIVILGILAVSAAPRFISISSDANAATIEALRSAIVSSNKLIYSKAIIQGIEDEASAEVTLANGDKVAVRYGYLTYDDSNRSSGGDGLTAAINFEICHHQASDEDCENTNWRYDIDDDHIQFYNVSIGADPSNGGGDADEPLCYLQYNLAEDENTPASYTVKTSEC